jgi:hypothetical protein
MTNLYYTSRAQAAYAAAEAHDDPRDKAAFRAAARTWERLAKPATDATYSMEPQRLQLAALKRDVAEATNAPATVPAVKEQDFARLKRFIAKGPATPPREEVEEFFRTRYPSKTPAGIDF